MYALRIQNKLFLTLLVTSIIAVAILVVLMHWSVGRGMVDYINKREADKLQPMISEIATRYGQYDNWQWLQTKPAVLRQIMFENLLLRRHDDQCEHDDDECRDHIRTDVSSQMLHSSRRRPDIAIVDVEGNTIVALNVRAKQRTKLAIERQGQTIAWVSIPQREKISEGFELLFLEQQRKAFWIMSLIVIALAGIIAFPLARHFVRPIEQLTDGANHLTQGKYTLHLPINRNDELGQLARDFNELATTLDQNESSRKRWLADISHELRTPLAILSGEIEAMIDGVRPISKQGIESMQEEVAHLSKLVNDLYELTKADIGGLSYRKAEIDLAELVRTKLTAYQPIFNEHKLSVSFDNTLPVNMWADNTRINQLLDNLLTNAYRYTNDGGQIKLSIQQDKHTIILLVEDSAPGVPDEALDQLFDYLYRTEQSRNRENGGSGLGLAICKRIVDGHGGTMTAEHSALGGVAIRVQFSV
ncbi:MAG: ATP-binding protein [Gammaproteobacteria bacterium]|nr:ATP-binding protein [Gammaproteobacteria bacterium]